RRGRTSPRTRHHRVRRPRRFGSDLARHRARKRVGRASDLEEEAVEFRRIDRLPPYVFNVVNDMKAAARRAGEDVIDLGMGNPDLATPSHIVDKLTEAAENPRNHRYSTSRGIPKLRQTIVDRQDRQFNVWLL